MDAKLRTGTKLKTAANTWTVVDVLTMNDPVTGAVLSEVLLEDPDGRTTSMSGAYVDRFVAAGAIEIINPEGN